MRLRCDADRAVVCGEGFGYKPANLLTFVKPLSGRSEPMTVWMRGSLSAAGIATIALVLAACQSTGSNTANLNTIGAPQQLAPVQLSDVQQGTLPAIGATGTRRRACPASRAGRRPRQPADGVDFARHDQPWHGRRQCSPAARSFRSIRWPQPAAGGMGSGPEGVWNVVAGTSQCRLNLPMTSKTGTDLLPRFGSGLRRAGTGLGHRLAAGGQPAAAL